MKDQKIVRALEGVLAAIPDGFRQQIAKTSPDDDRLCTVRVLMGALRELHDAAMLVRKQKSPNP